MPPSAKRARAGAPGGAVGLGLGPDPADLSDSEFKQIELLLGTNEDLKVSNMEFVSDSRHIPTYLTESDPSRDLPLPMQFSLPEPEASAPMHVPSAIPGVSASVAPESRAELSSRVNFHPPYTRFELHFKVQDSQRDIMLFIWYPQMPSSDMRLTRLRGMLSAIAPANQLRQQHTRKGFTEAVGVKQILCGYIVGHCINTGAVCSLLSLLIDPEVEVAGAVVLQCLGDKRCPSSVKFVARTKFVQAFEDALRSIPGVLYLEIDLEQREKDQLWASTSWS